MSESLNWESTYAIALALKAAYPEIDLTDVSLNMIYDWTIALENFEDEPALANDQILASIYQDWFEETLHDPK
jgi:FeS assembly protein IscX